MLYWKEKNSDTLYSMCGVSRWKSIASSGEDTQKDTCAVAVDGEIIRLLVGPSNIVMKFDGYIINGLKFRSKQRESKRKKPNRGIVVTTRTESYSTAHDLTSMAGVVAYYEIIKEIIEVYYYGYMKVVISIVFGIM